MLKCVRAKERKNDYGNDSENACRSLWDNNKRK